MLSQINTVFAGSGNDCLGWRISGQQNTTLAVPRIQSSRKHAGGIYLFGPGKPVSLGSPSVGVLATIQLKAGTNIDGKQNTQGVTQQVIIQNLLSNAMAHFGPKSMKPCRDFGLWLANLDNCHDG